MKKNLNVYFFELLFDIAARLKRDIVGTVLGLLIMILGMSFVYSQMEVIVITEEERDTPFVVYAGESVDICRTVEYTRKTLVSMNRALLRNTISGDLITINLPEVTFDRVEGKRRICRKFVIPDYIGGGDWLIRTYLTVNTFPFWSATQTAPDIHVTVHRRE